MWTCIIGTTSHVWRGTGVVGLNPDLRPGAVFEYHSGTSLDTPVGQMQGSFQMTPLGHLGQPGAVFDALIQPFQLLGRATAHPDDQSL